MPRPTSDSQPDAADTGGCPIEICPKLADLVGYLRSLSGRPDLDTLAKLLGELDVTADDLCTWQRFGEKAYKRNIIDKNEHYELLAVCWKSGQATPIHDHAGSACAFKVIHGTGREIRYEPTPCGQVIPSDSVTMERGYICSAEDEDIHRVANAEGEGDDLITLHVYAPPLKGIQTYAGLDAKLSDIVKDSGSLYQSGVATK